jgi:hypothetical protein
MAAPTLASVVRLAKPVSGRNAFGVAIVSLCLATVLVQGLAHADELPHELILNGVNIVDTRSGTLARDRKGMLDTVAAHKATSTPATTSAAH